MPPPQPPPPHELPHEELLQEELLHDDDELQEEPPLSPPAAYPPLPRGRRGPDLADIASATTVLTTNSATAPIQITAGMSSLLPDPAGATADG